jgi:ABC-type glycerol-3-phosphate transport system substrate-binding protein
MENVTRRQAISKIAMAGIGAVAVVAVGAGAYYYLTLPPPRVTVRGIYEKLPPTDIYATAMKAETFADVIPEGTDYADMEDKTRVAMSTKSATYDFFGGSDGSLPEYLKAGWCADLTSALQKYWSDYNLDDIPSWVWGGVKSEGKTYAIPYMMNTQLYFYRMDLFQEKGFQVPKTIEDWYGIAQALHQPDKNQYGVAMAFKDWDVADSEFRYFLHASGGEFFDSKWNPTFNDDKGVLALDWLTKFSKLAQPGWLSAGNDEKMVAFQQALTATGLLWATRCGGMDNPSASKVVNKIGFDLLPKEPGAKRAGQRQSVDCWFVSAFSKNVETTVRVLVEASRSDVQKQVSQYGLVSRKSALDAAAAKFRYVNAAMANFEQGAFDDHFPEVGAFHEQERVELTNAVTGAKTSKQALDDLATWTHDMLAKAGYY